MVGINQDWDFAKKREKGEFPGGLVVRILGFHCCGPGSIPHQGTENPKEKKKKQREGILRYLHESDYVLDHGYKLSIKESKHKKELVSVDSEKLIGSMVSRSP